MPLVDVTELLTDPDIAGQFFTIIRRQEIVNNFGESTWVIQKIPTIGSVQPSGDNSLIREDGLDAQSDSIKLCTTFRLRGVSKGPNASRFKPDIVLWMGNYFEVITVNSWSDFGAGLIDAEATSVHYVDLPADTLRPYVGQLNFTQGANGIYAHGAMMGGI
jgi:hypothetical protein